MSGVATNLMQAVVDSSVREIDGKTLTRPALLTGDQSGVQTYCVDVDIGQKRVDPNDGEEVLAILKNVVIAAGDQLVIYADVGSAVRLHRSDSGRWEIRGFSKTLPGTYTRIAVSIGEPSEDSIEFSVGTPGNISLSSHLLAYDELADYGAGYGAVPYGAIGVFRGQILVEIR